MGFLTGVSLVTRRKQEDQLAAELVQAPARGTKSRIATTPTSARRRPSTPALEQSLGTKRPRRCRPAIGPTIHSHRPPFPQHPLHRRRNDGDLMWWHPTRAPPNPRPAATPTRASARDRFKRKNQRRIPSTRSPRTRSSSLRCRKSQRKSRVFWCRYSGAGRKSRSQCENLFRAKVRPSLEACARSLFLHSRFWHTSTSPCWLFDGWLRVSGQLELPCSSAADSSFSPPSPSPVSQSFWPPEFLFSRSQ
mmetsp:Transcript_27011/g.57300  ORF Transcript_27011/g.57300 Transcript_27011/m.57300 type:complete len:249 (-) Transcript_27011:100-846(-)